MLTASKWLLIVAGALLIIASIFTFAGFGPLLDLFFLRPVMLLLLGVGLLLFAIGSKAFVK